MEKSIEELIYEETQKRLKEMASPDYSFPEPAGKRDLWEILIGAGLSLLLILLCMTGVIV